jgi:hypothetical protein
LDARQRPCSKKIVTKSKEVKTGWSNSRQFWQNILRKALAQKGLFANENYYRQRPSVRLWLAVGKNVKNNQGITVNIAATRKVSSGVHSFLHCFLGKKSAGVMMAKKM